MARIVGISYHKSVAPSMTLTLWLTTANTTSTNWNASLSMLAHLLMLVIISLTGQTMAQTLTTGSNMMILNTHLSYSINFPDSLIYLFSGSKHNQVHDQAFFMLSRVLSWFFGIIVQIQSIYQFSFNCLPYEVSYYATLSTENLHWLLVQLPFFCLTITLKIDIHIVEDQIIKHTYMSQYREIAQIGLT